MGKWQNVAKKWEMGLLYWAKTDEIWQNGEGKGQIRKEGKNQEASFTLPLLTGRTGYTTENSQKVFKIPYSQLVKIIFPTLQIHLNFISFCE